jgi:thymidylate kinase
LDFFRKVKRLIIPTGLFIVVLGVDGAGKSSVTQKLKQKYDAFREIRVYHSRLGMVKNLGKFKKNKSVKEAEYKNPHSHKKNSFFNSLIRFLYYFLDYFIGGILITYYKRRSKLIIIERYYYDYYIDKIRYKINLPDFLLKFFNLFVKKPDLIFILTGDTVKLYERKKEISIHQIDKQKKLLELHFGKRKDSIFIDTVNSDIDSTVNEIIYKCNSYMRNRMERFTRRNNHK